MEFPGIKKIPLFGKLGRSAGSPEKKESSQGNPSNSQLNSSFSDDNIDSNKAADVKKDKKEAAGSFNAKRAIKFVGTQKKTGREEAIEAAPSSGKERQEKQVASFSIDKTPTLIELPPFENANRIDVRYPLIPPYAYAHLFWDKDSNELVYTLEEPALNKIEKELLKLIQLGLEEMINVSFIRAKEANLVMEYLERNVQSILVELGAKISKEAYERIMYYIYRDSIGLNDIEPLMNDHFIEDVECNGLGFPIYIVHRKYQNLRTNVMFKDPEHLTDFVEKLAQKAGRYVSFARPLLDGTLPDGSRVNATYTGDITTRGPTFTIRKFTKEPWTPVHLINMHEANAETFAYLWLAIENKFNIMTIGETASGKTTFMNSIIHFVPSEARICSIEDTREINLAHSNWLPSVIRTGFGVPNIMGIQHGEITLFDLLRETFRQNPDYVVVGEVRGNETYVLFQGMASGHPSFSTFHANSVATLVRRLETPPISLPSSLVESLDIVCVTNHIKGREQNFRRMTEIEEIISVKSEVGKVESNKVFSWDPRKDIFEFSGKSVIFKKIMDNTGITKEALDKEFKARTKLLTKLVDNKIFDFIKVNEILNTFIKNRDALPADLKV